jgi:hypothetical protein
VQDGFTPRIGGGYLYVPLVVLIYGDNMSTKELIFCIVLLVIAAFAAALVVHATASMVIEPAPAYFSRYY